jgi:formate/nitrite transporter FocA (FNT family)
MLNGAQVTVKDMMLNNILPVTLGNVISAVLFVAGLHFWAYGRQK